METSDSALVSQARQGDDGAFALLVHRHQRYVYNLAYRLLRDPEEAADLTQEAFLRAWRGLGGFRSEAKFTTWLYRIVTNLCYNRLPGLRRQIAEVEIESADARTSSSQEIPHAAIEASEQSAFLHQQIASLPAKYQLIVTLFYLQELSYQEIAKVLDMPLGTVKTHLFRARDQLRHQMAAGTRTEKGIL